MELLLHLVIYIDMKYKVIGNILGRLDNYMTIV